MPDHAPDKIFNRDALRKSRTRAAQHLSEASFLLEEVMDELAFRLSAVNRQFDTGVSLGSHRAIGVKYIEETGKISHLIQLDSCPQMINPSGYAGIVAEEDILPLKDRSLDIVISPLSLQWVNDLPGSLIQLRRALKQDGLFLAAIIGGESLNELRTCFLRAESEITGGAHPRVFPFIDVKTLGGLLQRAGFALPVIDREIRKVRYGDPLSLLHDLKKMGATNILTGRSKTLLRRDVLARMLQLYTEHFSDSDGKTIASFEIIYLSAWAPDDSQPKPLKPGSATHSLAEALKPKK